MTALISAEWRKLRTVRVNWVLFGIGLVLIVAGASGLLSRRSPDDPTLAAAAIAHVGLVSLISLIIGIITVAGEYRHRTITETYLATPARWPVLAAKLVIACAAGAAFAAAGAVLAAATAAAWLGGFDAGRADVWQTIGGGIAWNVLFAAAGVGVAALTRSMAGAIAGSLAWIAVVEGIVGSVVGSDLSRWLPFQAGMALGRIGRAAPGHLPQPGAGALLAGYAAILVVAGLVTVMRRDVDG